VRGRARAWRGSEVLSGSDPAVISVDIGCAAPRAVIPVKAI
jgi:hypothetical protein